MVSPNGVFYLKHLPMYTTNKKFMLFYCLVLISLIAGVAVAAANHKPIPRCEYHIRLEPNYAYTYDNDGKLIGVCDYGKDGIDSVILKDNE